MRREMLGNNSRGTGALRQHLGRGAEVAGYNTEGDEGADHSTARKV